MERVSKGEVLKGRKRRGKLTGQEKKSLLRLTRKWGD